MCAYIIYYISFLVYNEGSSKTHQSSLTLKGGSTAFPKPLSPQGTGDVPTALLGAQTATLYGWRTIRGLRQQQSCSFLCGMNRMDTLFRMFAACSMLKGCLLDACCLLELLFEGTTGTRWMAHCVIC